MTRQELQKQILQLPMSERLQIVQSVIASIQQETNLPVSKQDSNSSFVQTLDPWTQSLVGIASSDSSGITSESYIDYLEKKYS